MNWFNASIIIANLIFMFANLLWYGLVSPAPYNLAAGIICGFVMLACMMAERK